MPASYGLFAVATAAHWSIGSLALRGDDVYAVVGLIAAIIVLSLWVVIENLRRTRWNPEKISASRARQHTATPGSPETHAKAEPDMTPVAARAEWLLDDNTLVRTGAVHRGSMRRAAAQARPAVLAATPDATPATPVMRSRRPLHIAMMGSRGIPADASRREACIEQLAVRLVERGHQVTVYCQPHHGAWPDKTYKGVRLVKLPTIAGARFKTLAHTWLSMVIGQFRRYDVVYIFGVGNGPLAGIPRLTGKPTIIRVGDADGEADGRISERLAAKFASCVVADSRATEKYFYDTFKTPAVFLPYGSDVPRTPPGSALRQLGLRPDGYIFWAGRLVPENNAHDVIEAYQTLGGPATGLQLCLVGDAPHGSDYAVELRRKAGSGVVFAGNAFGDSYHELDSNARMYVFSSGVGGPHPALLEALLAGNCVIVNDLAAGMAANGEAFGDATLTYTGAGGASDLARVLAQVVANPALVENYRQRAARLMATRSRWDTVIDQYEDLFARLARD